MKKAHILITILLLLVLTSCTLADRIADKLGFDTYDYMGETVNTVHPTDGELSEDVEDILEILVTDSTILPTFDNMGDAIKAYNDAVLTHMLETGYSKYSGNVDLISKAIAAYPEYSITQIIPQAEYEATMYQYFGGDVKITHRDGERFKYLSKVSAYISPVAPTESGLHPDVTYLAETDKTYRVKFRVVTEDESMDSPEYFALIIKRDDGTHYIKKLLDGSDVQG